MSNVHNMTPLKGIPVFVLRRGQYPSSNIIRELMVLHPGYTLHVEANHFPYTTFIVTATKHRH